jgi:hypothetical protein
MCIWYGSAEQKERNYRIRIEVSTRRGDKLREDSHCTRTWMLSSIVLHDHAVETPRLHGFVQQDGD